jgi:myo-inositol-1(or 4)-monophosphatase
METGTQQDLQTKLYDSALEYAKQAGRLVLEHMGKLSRIEQKKNVSDLVTEVDRMSEKLLWNKIQQEYPDHWILSEEDSYQVDAYEAFKSQNSGYGWIIDPIDGTTNFIHGIPHFAVSIGIVKDGEPIIGVVYNLSG